MEEKEETNTNSNGNYVCNDGIPDNEGSPALLLLSQDEKFIPANSDYCMWTLLVTTASTMMSVGLAVGCLNPTIIVMTSFYNETYIERYDEVIPESSIALLIAFTVSMLLAGGFLGALSIGIFTRNFTRKQSMIIINIINVLSILFGSIAGYFIPSYEAIIIARFFMGFVAGVAMNVIPMITSETSAKPRSAFYLSLIGVYLSFGGLLGLILGYKQILGNERLWPLLLSIPALPSLTYLFVSPWLPETPSYLLLVNKHKEAFQTLKLLRNTKDETLLRQELQQIQREQDAEGSKTQSVPLIAMFRHAGYRRQLFLLVMVFMESQFCGINGIGMYTDVIFMQAKINKQYVTYASTIVYSVQFFVALAGSKAVDKWGPRRLSIFWSISMTISLTLLTISMAASSNAVMYMEYISVVAVTFYVLSWACGPNITLFPLIAALTTEPTRESSFKFGGGLFWIASWFVSFMTPYLLKYLGSYAFLPYAICNFFFTIFFFLKIPETRNKTSEDIQAIVQGKAYRGGVQVGDDLPTGITSVSL